LRARQAADMSGENAALTLFDQGHGRCQFQEECGREVTIADCLSGC
jgi:hypothetical protein